MNRSALWKQFISWGITALVAGVFLGVMGLANEHGVAIFGAYLLTFGGVMVVHAGLIGAVVEDASRRGSATRSAPAPPTMTTPSDPGRPATEGRTGGGESARVNPEQLRSSVATDEVLAFLHQHPHATLDEVARGLGTTPAVAADELEGLARRRVATAHQGRWALRNAGTSP